MNEILVQDVRKEFRIGRERLEVLKGITLRVSKGERLSIIGISGAGKSTLLHIMGGLDRPSSGRVLFDKEDVFRQSDAGLAHFRNKRVGFVFQFHHLLSEFSVLENVMMPCIIAGGAREKVRAWAVESLEKVGLEKRLRHKPGELSGGEQQRVAIARALSGSPEVILADEPTGNLDKRAGNRVVQVLLDLQEKDGCALILVTHNEGISERMERTIMLEDGRVVEERRHC